MSHRLRLLDHLLLAFTTINSKAAVANVVTVVAAIVLAAVAATAVAVAKVEAVGTS